jgi:hypothetical protein
VAQGVEFRVNTVTFSQQWRPSVASDANGNFVVSWSDKTQDRDGYGVVARRFAASGVPRGADFLVNTYTASNQRLPGVAADASGNFVVIWNSAGQDGSDAGVFGQRFGGLVPTALNVDTAVGGNGVLEPGESVDVKPSWRNVNGAALTFAAGGSSLTGPPASGVSYELHDAVGDYGTVSNGATAECSDCYHVGVTFAGTRPALHWDATLEEHITPDSLGQTEGWALHVGESFADVPRSNSFYRFVETLLHHGVTGGCSAGQYCPASPTLRREMAVFVLRAKEGGGFVPPACATSPFADVSTGSVFCPFIRELSQRGIVQGCGGGNYCPGSPVLRQEMAVFVLRTLDPTFAPPPCAAAPFVDVPTSNPFCPDIAELKARNIVQGCGGGNYCPALPVTRQEMGVFISRTFGLALYGS